MTTSHEKDTTQATYEVLRVQLQKGRKEVISEHVAQFGYRNVNEFVKTAIVQLMQRDMEQDIKPSPIVPILNADEEARERALIEQAIIESD